MQQHIASEFAYEIGCQANEIPVLCTLKILNRRTALDIHQISEFPNEDEVLILPYTAFTIVNIKEISVAPSRFEIELQECEKWHNWLPIDVLNIHVFGWFMLFNH